MVPPPINSDALPAPEIEDKNELVGFMAELRSIVLESSHLMEVVVGHDSHCCGEV